ncbi:MAG: hypothetical protein SGJ19_09170 [Planctomycetia bacterium]|nr:hypothetical protein [Planctomycetia bacterium]
MFRRQQLRLSRHVGSRSLRFEHCEDRRLMAADLHLAAPVAATEVAAPVAPPSNGIIAILIGLYRTPPSAPATGANAMTVKPSQAVSVDVWEHAALSDPNFEFVK